MSAENNVSKEGLREDMVHNSKQCISAGVGIGSLLVLKHLWKVDLLEPALYQPIVVCGVFTAEALRQKILFIKTTPHEDGDNEDL